MTALGDVAITEKTVAPNAGVTVILVETPATFIGATDTFTVDLKKWGCTKVHTIVGSSQTTTGTVLATATFAVDSISDGVAVISTSGAGTNIYGIVIYAY